MADRYPALWAEGIHREFAQPNGERLNVLDGVDFEIFSGEMVAVMGPSGSGKSTLLQILGLMMSPDRGQIKIFGQLTQGLSEYQRDQLRREEIGFLFQFDSLMEELTLEENLRLVQGVKGVGFAGELAYDLRAVANRLNMGHRLSSYPRELSVGECCRANLLRALIGSPSLIFADEPTGNLDAKNAKQLMDEFLSLLSSSRNGKNPAIVLATHNAELAALADRIVVLEDGRLQSAGVGARSAQ